MTPKRRPERISYAGADKQASNRGDNDWFFSSEIRGHSGGRRRKTIDRKQNQDMIVIHIPASTVKLLNENKKRNEAKQKDHNGEA